MACLQKRFKPDCVLSDKECEIAHEIVSVFDSFVSQACHAFLCHRSKGLLEIIQHKTTEICFSLIHNKHRENGKLTQADIELFCSSIEAFFKEISDSLEYDKDPFSQYFFINPVVEFILEYFRKKNISISIMRCDKKCNKHTCDCGEYDERQD